MAALFPSISHQQSWWVTIRGSTCTCNSLVNTTSVIQGQQILIIQGKLSVFCQAFGRACVCVCVRDTKNNSPTGQGFSSVWDCSSAFVWKEIFPLLLFFQCAWKPPHTFTLTLSSSLVGQTHACQHLWLTNTGGIVIWFHLKPFKDI